MVKTALIAGASGLVGGHCLDALLHDRNYAHVVSVGRRELPRTHERLEQLVVDFERLEDYRSKLASDDVFCCLGTTMRKAGSKAAFRKVDYEYPLRMAKLAKELGASRLMVVTAVGSSVSSKFFYSRVKGELERDLAALQFEQLGIFQPSFLVGERGEHRPSETFGIAVVAAASPLLAGPFRRYRPIAAATVANAMVAVAQTGRRGTEIFEGSGIEAAASR